MKYILMAAVSMGSLIFVQNAYACSVGEATAKLNKISQSAEYKAFVSSAKTAEDAQKVVALTSKLSDSGTKMSQGDFEGACAGYDEIIEQLEIE